jgi:hypothetical protein
VALSARAGGRSSSFAFSCFSRTKFLLELTE